jgi:hypothetical protein
MRPARLVEYLRELKSDIAAPYAGVVGTPAEGRSRICPPGARADKIHPSPLLQGSQIWVCQTQSKGVR